MPQEPGGRLIVRALLAAACLATATLGLAACGSGGSSTPTAQTFQNSDFPLTFRYPDSFEQGNDISLSTRLGSSSQATAAVALDDSNAIVIQKYGLNVKITQANLGLAKREADALVDKVNPGASGDPGEIAGKPSLTYRSVPLEDPANGESKLTMVFAGAEEYLVNCQSTPAHRHAIDSACDQALRTLKFVGG